MALPCSMVFPMGIIIVKLDEVTIARLLRQVPASVSRPEDSPAVGEVVKLVGITSDLILGEYQDIVAIDSLVLLAVLILIIDHDKDLPGITVSS